MINTDKEIEIAVKKLLSLRGNYEFALIIRRHHGSMDWSTLTNPSTDKDTGLRELINDFIAVRKRLLATPMNKRNMSMLRP